MAPVPPITDDGTITMPSFPLPFSMFASPEARQGLVDRLRAPTPSPASLAERRRMSDEALTPAMTAFAQRYPYTSTRSTIENVTVETIVPTAGIAPENRNRVLIGVHGGGFVSGGGGQMGRLEAVPVAGLARIRVVAVDYRLQPEHTMQDAINDVLTVYRELLRTHRPENIGIFGCSAGGALTNYATTAMIRQNLPTPGAIGIFCASLVGFGDGDSGHIMPRTGSFLRMLPGPAGAPPQSDPFRPTEAEMRQFPPTLFLTGTRAPEMSGAVQSHLVLRRLGVDSDLLLFDGLDHGFFLFGYNYPEAAQAQQLQAQFFMDHLGQRRGQRR